MTSDAPALFPEMISREHTFSGEGLLPDQLLEELIRDRSITSSNPISDDQIQPASIDLRLQNIAYRVPASFLPTKSAPVQRKLQEIAMEEIDLSKPALLRAGGVYVVPLQEELFLPDRFSGIANPKSSTGRLDILTRLLTDYGTKFEEVPNGYKGKLYAEVVPLTFSVIVQEGTRLNQLRLRRGDSAYSDAMLRRLHRADPLVYSQDATPAKAIVDEGLRLSVDLEGSPESDIIGYRARRDTRPIDLSRVGHYESAEFWEPLRRNSRKSITLEAGQFYILTSKEKVSVPPAYAAEMVPYDPFIGEFRIHYAGFFDPGFGWFPEDKKGTHAVLEVRSHQLPSILEHGQIVCRLVYERLIGQPLRTYGQKIGSSYHSQRLALSKHFSLGG
jgi:dCTP deaminase